MVTCEHAVARVPPRWRTALAGRRGLLRTHRAFDRGAIAAARTIARAVETEVLAADVTRLLADTNRAETNPAVFGLLARGLDAEEREALLRLHHRPHRRRVARTVDRAIAARGRVVHVAVHSFTPVLRGRRRDVDVGLLFDPRREGEVRFAEAWRDAIRAREPRLRVARNRPYRGWTDGLATALREARGDGEYVGVELELNQGLVRDRRRWSRVVKGVAEALVAVVGG